LCKATAEPSGTLGDYLQDRDSVLEDKLKVSYTTLVAALLTAGAATAEPMTLHIGDEGSTETQGFITREWTWSTGTTITNFTAYGPSDLVSQLDPQDSTPECQGCELASSTYFEPGDEVGPASSPQVAD
jgi:hypothetical protein